MSDKDQSIDVNYVKAYLLDLQDSLCHSLEAVDGEEKFIEDNWVRAEGGGGRTRVLEYGGVFEKGGVSFSHVVGESLPAAATASRPQLAGRKFTAMGVSLVVHPRNPFVPTAHMNVRMFMAEKKGKKPIWWFGGGFDMTPYYGFEEDCIHWHQVAKQACDQHHPSYYEKYKTWCDEYFYLKHRNEPRGIGGLFFDDFSEGSFEASFEFMQSIGNAFVKAYVPIIRRRKETIYEERHRQFQLYRRGRYVEFNLIHDRGTLFGLQSNGRTESILMSLPPSVAWHYNYHPEKDSIEAELYEEYLKPRDWLALDEEINGVDEADSSNENTVDNQNTLNNKNTSNNKSTFNNKSTLDDKK